MTLFRKKKNSFPIYLHLENIFVMAHYHNISQEIKNIASQLYSFNCNLDMVLWGCIVAFRGFFFLSTSSKIRTRIEVRLKRGEQKILLHLWPQHDFQLGTKFFFDPLFVQD